MQQEARSWQASMNMVFMGDAEARCRCRRGSKQLNIFVLLYE